MQVTKVQTKIGTVTFKQVNEKRFVVRCKGKTTLHIKQEKDGWWVSRARLFSKSALEVLSTAGTPAKCYKNAVKSFWM